MKGAPWFVAGGTIAGLVAVLGYHTQTLPASALNGPGAAAGSSAAPPSASASASASPSATASGAGSGVAGPSATGTSNATGPKEQFGYGELAVDVTVKNGRITKVTVPTLNVAEPLSQQISDRAVPMLTQEVISAQSLKINAVSGATYTSDAYAQSLQAALNKLHFK